MLRVRLLGGLAIEVDDLPLPPPGGRPARALLAWLALNPGLHARSRVAGHLWPDVREDSARASLRNALMAVRRALGEDGSRYLVAQRDRVGLAAEGVWVDVLEARALEREGRLEEAAALARGELLPGLDADWVHDARDAHARGLVALTGATAAAAEARGDLAEAVRLSREAVALDPLAEAAHRELIRRLMVSGDRAAARAAYERLRDLLRERLGVAPAPETRALLEEVPGAAAAAEPAAARELPPVLRRRPRSGLVGRERELAVVRGAWERAVAGERVMAVAVGEPGVGKTRLAGELARAAHREGALVLLGRAREEAMVPYGAVAEALRPYISARPAAALGPLAGELARLVPELSPRLPAALGGDPEGARYRLFEAVAWVLGAAAREAPAVLVIDDLQWADASTAQLLAHCARALPDARLLILATSREAAPPDGPLAALAAELRAEGALVRVDLDALDRDGVAAMMASWAGPGAPGAIVEAVRTATGGVPFLVEEVMRHLEDAGRLGPGRWPAPGDLGLPEGARDAVSRRLDRLGDPARWVLRLAALAGSTIAPGDLEASAAAARRAGAAPVEPGTVLDALEAAAAARLLRQSEDPGSGEGYEFAHALVRETLLAELSPARAARMHAAVAEALEARPAGREAEVARHLAEAGEAGDPVRVSASAHAAIEGAMAQAAYEQAARYAEEALGADVGPGAGAAARRASLLLCLGEARARVGDREAAARAFSRAAGLARETGDARMLAMAALGSGGHGVLVDAEDPALSALLREALEALGDDDDALRGRLLGRLSTERYYAGSEERGRLSAAALAAAEASGDAQAELDALVHRRVALWDPDHLDERIAVSSKLLARARQARSREHEIAGHHWLVVDLMEKADIASAEEEIAAHEALAEELRLPGYRWYGIMWRALLTTLRGDFDSGRRLAAEAEELGRRVGDVNATIGGGMTAIAELLLTGRLAELDTGYMEWKIASSPAGPSYRTMLAWVLALRGQREAAAEQLAVAAAGGFASIARNVNWPSAVLEGAEAAMLLGDRAVMETALELAQPMAGRMVTAGRAHVAYGFVNDLLGRLCAALGRPDEAGRYLEAARDQALAAGFAPFVARIETAMAQAAGAGL
jgi:DNA-binding SARP family transcriptional activator